MTKKKLSRLADMAMLRAVPRAPLAHGTQLKDSKKTFSGALLDISETGAKLSGAESIKVDSSIEIYWTPIVGLKPFCLVGKCVWKDKDQAGIKFVSIDEKTKCVLRSLVKFHLGA